MRAVDPALYPFAEHWLDVDGLRLHYVDEGQGRPVVFVHGNPTWSFYWREAIKALQGTRRCVALDHIGCGKSDKPGDDRYTYTLQRRVEDLGRLIDHLGLDQVDLVAHDWGGMIATSWATQHPQRVGRLALLNTGAFTNPKGQKLPGTLRLARDSKLGALLVRGFNAFSAGATRLAVTQPLPKNVRQGLTAPYDSWADRIATLRFVQDIPLGPEDPAYAVVAACEQALADGVLADKPTLLLWGMKDFVFDKAFLDRFLALMPHATAHRFEDAGHYVIEDARDRVLPLLVEFLG
ncbi:MAG: alpha/beta fold hydrolase [Myxococcales bacterium]|nr:alpha/beta fold hydrolase [Myxococcales bacterium]